MKPSHCRPIVELALLPIQDPRSSSTPVTTSPFPQPFFSSSTASTPFYSPSLSVIVTNALLNVFLSFSSRFWGPYPGFIRSDSLQAISGSPPPTSPFPLQVKSGQLLLQSEHPPLINLTQGLSLRCHLIKSSNRTRCLSLDSSSVDCILVARCFSSAGDEEARMRAAVEGAPDAIEANTRTVRQLCGSTRTLAPESVLPIEI